MRIEEVPELLVTGLQAVEDRDFAHHHGIDLSGMLRAAFVTVTFGRREQAGRQHADPAAGAQRPARHRPRADLTRKVKEILYALLIEARYDKRTILETYLNQVYLGQRGSQEIRGVAAGAEFWFGRDLRDLSTEQVALLVGIIRGPSYYDPRRNPERATERRNFALAKMHETGLINDAEFARAQKAHRSGVTSAPGSLAANRFPAYVDLVRRQLQRDYPADALQGAGLSVMTGDVAGGAGLRRRCGDADAEVRSTRRSARRCRPGVMLTDVHDGEVRAVVGSREFIEHGFNRAVEAQRPVGSLLKPFVYLLALAQPDKWSLASCVDDAPVTIALGNGRRWTPGNSEGRSHGTRAPDRCAGASLQHRDRARRHAGRTASAWPT